ncbi:DUF58 domain-containing protein [Solwaraspora sp. WMMD791]|uniref:DUF58 domain-containing protein n=1 Tax=Solwaraspora sp. WMMD791 TaxID=3016086 RepID=UPI00249C766E|nr:DUF58 domain-containing protein [Solwaraspora sp. WMMD791]WFE30807.1 DUF58 domain-containing protein [Solwaraspora sp. WMMD791]
MDGAATLPELTPPQTLRRLELTVTRRLDGLLHGQHLGLLPGGGSELAGSREYRPGEDEVRRMDWAVTARTTVPHVREVDADRELTTWVLIDGSPSMDFGTAELEKRELAVAAVAAVGFLTAGTGNALGAHLLGVDGIRRFPTGSGRDHLLCLLRALLAAPRGEARPQPGGTTATSTPATLALADGIDGLRRAATRRGLAVVVSDFLDGLPDDAAGRPDWEPALRRLASVHQVLAVDITDPRELDLPDVGVITVQDPETGRRREISTASADLRRRYAEAAAGQRDQVARAIRRAQAAHLRLRTDRDWVADIVRHVHRQRQLAACAPAPAAGVREGTWR